MKRRTKLLLSRIPIWGSLFVALAMAVVIGTVLAQVDQLNLFELDGNATHGDQIYPYGPTDDWQNLANTSVQSPNSNLQKFTGIVVYPGTTLTTGGSKDTKDLGSWRWNTGSTPPKDQLTNAYAAAYTAPSHDGVVQKGDSIVYFGADRYANNGSAQIGFWFFQNRVTRNSDGTFTGVHADGDLLVLANFTTGGTVANIAVYEWQNGSPVLKYGSTSQCESGSVTEACAISNQEPVQLYWPYTAKFPTSGGTGASACSTATNCAPPSSFFEGGIDLNAVLGNTPTCISSFLVETRSSTSINAQLESFILGSFQLCSVAFDKTCPSGSLDSNGETFDYSYGGMVKNTGHGNLYNATVTDTFPANATDITSDGTNPASNCTGGGSSAVVCTFDIGTLGPGECNTWPTPGTATTSCPPSGGTGTFKSVTNGPQNSATAAASSSSSSSASLNVTANVYGGTATTDTVTCPTTTGSPAVSASKTCSVTVDPTDLSISVGYGGSICNRSPYAVSITGVTDAQNLPGGTFGTSTSVGDLTESDSATSVSLPYLLAPCPDGTTCNSTSDPKSCMLFGAPGTSDAYTPTQASNSDTATSACNINFSNTVTVTFTSPLFSGQKFTQTATETTPCALCSCASSPSTQ